MSLCLLSIPRIRMIVDLWPGPDLNNICASQLTLVFKPSNLLCYETHKLKYIVHDKLDCRNMLQNAANQSNATKLGRYIMLLDKFINLIHRRSHKCWSTVHTEINFFDKSSNSNVCKQWFSVNDNLINLIIESRLISISTALQSSQHWTFLELCTERYNLRRGYRLIWTRSFIFNNIVLIQSSDRSAVCNPTRCTSSSRTCAHHSIMYFAAASFRLLSPPIQFCSKLFEAASDTSAQVCFWTAVATCGGALNVGLFQPLIGSSSSFPRSFSSCFLRMRIM